MNIHRLGLIAVVAACGEAATEPLNNSSGPTAHLRIVHTVVRVGALDVLVADQVVLHGVPAAQVSPFVEVPAGMQQLAFRATGAGTAGPASTIMLAAGDSVTILTVDSSNVLNPWVLTDTNAVAPAGRSKLRAVHFAEFAPAIDVWRTQPDFQTPITFMFPHRYREVSPYVESDQGTWTVLVSTEARDSQGAPVVTDTLYQTGPIAVGSGDLRTVIVVDVPGDSGKVQAVVITP